MFTRSDTFASARRFSGGTGSSIQPGSNGPRAPAAREALRGARARERARRREAPGHLDEHVDVRADGVANRLDQSDRPQALVAVELEVAGAERIQLERPVAALDHGPRRRRELLGRALDRVPPVRVRRDPLADGPAEQPVHRWPSACPTMSQHAISTHAIADIAISPARA